LEINIITLIEEISNISMFKDFKQAEISKLFEPSKYKLKKYGKEQIIHFQNEICNTMDIILDGKVAVQKIDQNGNVLTIDIFYGGDILGANLLFSEKKYYPMTVIAISGATILHIKKELILKLCQSNLNFMINFMTAISDKTIKLTDKINAISLKTIRQCVIEFLEYEYHLQKSKVIKLNMSKKDLAERLGVQRSSLSRELNKMRKDGLLEFNAKTITIKNINIK